ncbi:MAG: mechanosensitive ion channel domain-containing protein [Polyangiales bacterium]|jgi:potassium efflux system protein
MNDRIKQWPAAAALGLCLSILTGAHAALAQIGPLRAPPEESAADTISAELAEIQRKTEEQRALLREWQAKSAEYLVAAREAPARIQVIDRDIQVLQKRDAISVSDEATVAELDAQLIEAQQDLAAARREAMELDAEAEQRAERRKKVPELLSIAKQKLEVLTNTPSTLPSDDPAVADALVKLEELRRAAQQAEVEAYQSELSSYDARGVLLGKRRDRATLRAAYYEALTVKLRDAKQRAERSQIERENEAAKRLLEELTALPEGFKETIRALYERNEALASLWTGDDGLHAQIDQVSEKLWRAEAQVADIESELGRLAARVEAVGLADSVGVLLRRRRAEAPDIGMYRRFIRMRQEQIGDVQLQQIKLREQRQALGDIDALVTEVMASVDEPLPPEQRKEVERLLRQLFETQRKYMDALIEDYETYFQKLVDFDAQQQELIDRTKDLLDFIDEHILWIPSGKAVQPELLSDGRNAMAWLFGPANWVQLGRGLRDTATRLWPLHLLALLLALLFLPFLRWVSPRIRALGQRAEKPDCAEFAPTVETLGLTLALAVWLPVLMAYVGWRLGLSPVATQFARSVAYGLVVTAAYWGTLRLARQLVRPGGLAEAHCGWSHEAAAALWRNLRWLTMITAPAVFVIFVLEVRGEDLWRESIGRLAFLVSMLAIAVFNYFALRRGGPFAEVLRGRRERRWLWRAVRLMSVAVPLVLGVGAFQGFYWTALQVAIRLHLNLALLFGLVIAVQLVSRWWMIAQRHAALEEEAPEQGASKPATTMEVSPLMVGTGLLLALLGTIAVWADLLPAARIFQQVELWSVTQTVTISQTDPSGVERFSTEDRLVAITLADLFRSLLIAIVTLASIRALPGLLEATLFRRLGPGERYAYSTIVKYAVVLAGLAFAFEAIGIGWSSIQWLVAAIGLGLGFGLQEIFANFVSGLIILFERPIRVGDTVTVGETSGTVSKIQIRATWITAFDRKELIVPNKEFVTGQLINWTLSDAVLRVDIPVGIAYGSDTERSIEILTRVAKESRRVLRDPPPQAFFLGFGDSSLSFELRVFVRTVPQLLPARHELHMSIDKAFREAGIEIAFPQRDLHIRSMPDDWRPPPTPTE